MARTGRSDPGPPPPVISREPRSSPRKSGFSVLVPEYLPSGIAIPKAGMLDSKTELCGFRLRLELSASWNQGQGVGVVTLLRGTGGVAPVGLVGLVKSAELTFVSVQLDVLIVDLAF